MNARANGMSQRVIAINAYRSIGDSPRTAMDANHAIAILVDPTKIPVTSSPVSADADHTSAGELAINQSKVTTPARLIFSFTKESCLGLLM